MSVLVNYIKHLGRKKCQSIQSFFQKMEAEGTLLNTFYKTSITLLPKPDKGIAKNI